MALSQALEEAAGPWTWGPLCCMVCLFTLLLLWYQVILLGDRGDVCKDIGHGGTWQCSGWDFSHNLQLLVRCPDHCAHRATRSDYAWFHVKWLKTVIEIAVIKYCFVFWWPSPSIKINFSESIVCRVRYKRGSMRKKTLFRQYNTDWLLSFVNAVVFLHSHETNACICVRLWSGIPLRVQWGFWSCWAPSPGLPKCGDVVPLWHDESGRLSATSNSSTSGVSGDISLQSVSK